jgi:hypothetical protein
MARGTKATRCRAKSCTLLSVIAGFSWVFGRFLSTDDIKSWHGGFGLAITNIHHADPPAATPEPGGLALLGTSILGSAGILPRRFRA